MKVLRFFFFGNVFLFSCAQCLASEPIWVRAGNMLPASAHESLAQTGKPKYVNILRSDVTIADVIKEHCGVISTEVLAILSNEFVRQNFGDAYFEEKYKSAGPTSSAAERLATKLEKDVTYAVPFCLPVFTENFSTVVQAHQPLSNISLRETGFVGPDTEKLFLVANGVVDEEFSADRATIKQLADKFSSKLKTGDEVIVPYRSQPVLFATLSMGETSRERFLDAISVHNALSEGALKKFEYQTTEEGQNRLYDIWFQQIKAPVRFWFDDKQNSISIKSILDDNAGNAKIACVNYSTDNVSAMRLMANCVSFSAPDRASASNAIDAKSTNLPSSVPHISPASEIDNTKFTTIPLTTTVGDNSTEEPRRVKSCQGRKYYPQFFKDMSKFDSVYEEQVRRMMPGANPSAVIGLVDNGLDNSLFKYMDGQKTPLSIFPVRHFKADSNECNAVLERALNENIQPNSDALYKILSMSFSVDANEDGYKGDLYGVRFKSKDGQVGFLSTAKASRHGSQVLLTLLGGAWNRKVMIREDIDWLAKGDLEEITSAQIHNGLRSLCNKGSAAISHKVINFGRSDDPMLLDGSDNFGKAVDYLESKKVNIVNLSLGRRKDLQPLRKVLRDQKERLLFVAAAGNLDTLKKYEERKQQDEFTLSQGYFPELYPAKYGGTHDEALPNVITVGGLGTNESDKSDKTFYSTDYVDLYAPSLLMPNADREGNLQCSSGTSIAAPIASHVAARVWVLLGVNASPSTVKQRIIFSADYIQGTEKHFPIRRLNPLNSLYVFDDVIKLLGKKGKKFGFLENRRLKKFCSKAGGELARKKIRRIDITARDSKTDTVSLTASVLHENKIKSFECSVASSLIVHIRESGKEASRPIPIGDIEYILPRSLVLPPL